MATNVQIFYVYEHWRLDRDECFYVGKGKGRRAYSQSGRNTHWTNIVSKLERNGFAYEIRFVATGLTENEAFSLEMERIAFWKDKADICNKTDGGDGVSGLVMSEEARKKMSERAKGRPGVKSMLGRKHTEETKAKMKAAKLGKLPNNAGKKYEHKPLSDDHKKALSAAKKGRPLSEKAYKNLIKSKKTNPVRLETRAKLSAAAKNQWDDPNKRPNRTKLNVGV
jgi:hypothetical protein